MKYYLKILNRSNTDGNCHIFIVDENGDAIPRQITININEWLDGIVIKMHSHHNPPQLHINEEEAARIYWTFEGKINGESSIEKIPFYLVDKSEDPVFEK